MSLITPDFGLLFWMTLIFAILFFVLAKFGFPAITGMVDKRSERINESIGKAREAEQKLERLSEQHTRMIEETRAEQARILKEASQAKDTILSQARQQAQDDAAKIMEQARTQIAAEKESALRDIRAQVANLSVDVAEKILRNRLSSEQAQMDLITRMVDELSNTNNPS
ncbi:MAG: F0F1 ATP synthase subunit B [Bacteroidia bacterium]|nr:F0F1 ATP synthase subunit B [Bacteroidia bacterium]